MNVLRTRTRRRSTAILLTPACVLVTIAGPISANAQCIDYSDDPAGCQPSVFDAPNGQMPSVRVDRRGGIDPTSSEADARADTRRQTVGSC